GEAVLRDALRRALPDVREDRRQRTRATPAVRLAHGGADRARRPGGRRVELREVPGRPGRTRGGPLRPPDRADGPGPRGRRRAGARLSGAHAGAPSAVRLGPLDELPEGGSRGYTVATEAGPLRIFAVRRDGRVHGYVNRCPHVG